MTLLSKWNEVSKYGTVLDKSFHAVCKIGRNIAIFRFHKSVYQKVSTLLGKNCSNQTTFGYDCTL